MSKASASVGALLAALSCASMADAQTVADLKGMYAFNWLKNPGRQTCVVVDGKLLADLRSPQYRCDLAPKTNTSAGHRVRTCTRVGGRVEYLIFDTRKQCEEERKTQASNGP